MNQQNKDVYDIGIFSKRFLIIMEISGCFILLLFKNTLTIFDIIRLLCEAFISYYLYSKCTGTTGDPNLFEEDLEMTISENEILKNDKIPQKNKCKVCNKIQTFRTKHCNKCQKCIPKYDHHCFWIGGCVGELNHRIFWLFLLTQTILCFDALCQFNYQLGLFYINLITKYQYILILFYAIISLGFGVFTFVLFLYHCMLILSGKTTWEHTKRDQISYLQFYPKYYHPFDYGIRKNIKLTLFHNNQLIQWQPIEIDLVKEQFNIFDNQYYSCC